LENFERLDHDSDESFRRFLDRNRAIIDPFTYYKSPDPNLCYLEASYVLGAIKMSSPADVDVALYNFSKSLQWSDYPFRKQISALEKSSASRAVVMVSVDPEIYYRDFSVYFRGQEPSIHDVVVEVDKEKRSLFFIDSNQLTPPPQLFTTFVTVFKGFTPTIGQWHQTEDNLCSLTAMHNFLTLMDRKPIDPKISESDLDKLQTELAPAREFCFNAAAKRVFRGLQGPQTYNSKQIASLKKAMAAIAKRDRSSPDLRDFNFMRSVLRRIDEQPQEPKYKALQAANAFLKSLKT
jgi:hypothetical protein